VPDWNNKRVHRAELAGSNAVTMWSVARYPVAVSVNSEHNLLVVSRGDRKLQMFTTHGTLLQDIQFPSGIDKPQSALQLPNGQLVVSNDASDNQLCLMRTDGQVLCTYKDTGSIVNKMSGPRGIAADKDGNLLVADMDNDRLFVFDQSLSRAQVMSVCIDGGMQRPRSLWYDQLQRRLYIGEFDERGRVIVIDNLKGFSTCTNSAGVQ